MIGKGQKIKINSKITFLMIVLMRDNFPENYEKYNFKFAIPSLMRSEAEIMRTNFYYLVKFYRN